MASAGTVEVSFAAETAKFTAQLKQVNDRLKGMESGFSAVSTAARAFIPVLSVTAIASFVRTALSAADALGDVADRIGVSVEALSRLQFAAQESDVEIEALNKSLQRFQITVSDAFQGIGSAQRSLSALNLTAADLRGIGLEQQLGIIADRFNLLSDPADRTRVAVDLFGKSGAELVPLLARGSAGISELTRRADELGITLNGRAVDGIDRASKALDRLAASARSVIANRFGTLVADIFGSGDELADAQARLDALIQRRRLLLESSDGEAVPGVAELDVKIKLAEQERNLINLQRFRAEAEARANDENLVVSRVAERLNVSIEEAKRQIEEFDNFLASGGQIEITARRTDDLTYEQEVAQIRAESQIEFERETNALMLAEQQRFIEESQRLADQGAEEYLRAVSRRNEEIALQERQHRELQLRDQQAYSESRIAMERNTMNAAVGYLQALATRSKTAAKILVAINKAQAIAKAIQNTATAYTNALASVPYPANIAAAASVAALGAAQVGLIAATGFEEIRSINNGGAQLGSAVNPVFTQNSNVSFDSNQANDAAQSQRTVQVVINGPIYNTDDFRASVADALKELDDIDHVIFSPNGQQAQTIRNG